MALTIGEIDYANCIPIFAALRESYDCGGYRFVRGVPARLNGLLQQGEIDVCPSSAAEYAFHPELYEILPDLSISANGPVWSVVLISRLPIEELDGRLVGLTTESATSVILLQILLRRELGLNPTFERTGLPPTAALEKYDALLLIGDTALRESTRAGSHFVYDLGKLWHEATGLPFVFALWLVRRDTARSRTAEVRQLAARLTNARARAYDSYERIAARCGQLPWLDRATLVDYWRTISYDLSPDHLAGLTLFFERGAELGLFPSAPTPRIFS